jgi:PAS domain S-box-containing protein
MRRKKTAATGDAGSLRPPGATPPEKKAAAAKVRKPAKTPKHPTVDSLPRTAVKPVSDPFDQAVTDMEQLARSILLYHGLFYHVGTGVTIYEARDDGEDFVFLDVNPAGERLNRLTKDEVVGRSILEMFPGVREMGLFGVLQQVWRTGVPQTLPLREYRDDRISQWVENYVFKLPSGEIVAIFEDITARKQLETSREEGLHFIETLVDTIPTPIFYKDAEGVYRVCNQAFSEAIGLAKEKIVGRSVFDIAPRPLAEKYREMDEALLRQGGVQTYEYLVRFADGSLHDIVFIKAVFPRADGTPAGLVGVMYDISFLREAEKRLRRSEQKFSAAFHLNPNPMAITDMDTALLVDINEAFVRWSGYSREEVLGRSTVEMGLWVDPDERQRIACDLRNGGVILNREARMRTKGGDVRDILFSARLIEIDAGTRLLTMAVDVTEQRRMETELRRSEKRYRSLIETTRDLIYTTNRKDFITYANPTLARTLGYADHELEGMSFVDILAPEYTEFARNIFRRTMKGGSVPIYEVEMVRKDGIRLSVEFNTETVLDSDGRPAGQLGIGRDVTIRRRAEQALRDSEAELAAIYENAPLIMMLIDEQWRVHKANAFASRLTGKSPGDLTALKCGEVFCCLHALDVPEGCGHGPSCQDCTLRLMALETIETGRGCSQKEVGMHLSDRGHEREVTFLVSTRRVTVKEKPLAMVSIQDISERKTAERRRILVNEILDILNSPCDVADIIRRVLLCIRDFTGVEAAGVRIQEGRDYPYYETNGFPGHFVEAERFLCTRDENNEIVLDSHGNPYLECMCGNVISGRTDPHLPFFTAGGSFWTNSTSELLASTTEEDRQTRTRNRCHGEGYESVALIPLRSGTKTIGLLQLNDPRTGRFTLDLIEFLEGVASSIGIAAHRQRTAETVSASNRFLDSLIGSMQEGFSALDAKGVHILVNDAFCQMTGFPREELIGRGLPHPYWPPEHREAIEATFGEVRKPGKKEFELTFMRKNGDRFPVIVIPSSIGDATGDTVMFATIKDISERKQMERALRESEARYRSIFENAVEGIFQSTPEGRFIRVNPAYARIFGYDSPEELVESVVDIPGQLYVNPKDRERAFAILEPEKRLKNFECLCRRKDGTEIWVSINSRFGKTADGMPCYEGFVRDITEQKTIEDALGKSAQRLKLAQESSGAGLWDWDMTSETLEWSRELFLLFGLDPEITEATFDVWNQVLHPEDKEITYRRIDLAIQNRTSLDSDYRIIKPGGQVRWIKALGNTAYDDSGQPVRMAGICLDITERKHAEEALRERDDRFKKLSSQVPGMIYQFLRRKDGTYCLPFTTEAIKGIFGCSPEDVREDFSPIARVILPEDLDRVVDSIESSAEGMTPWQCEYRVRIPGRPVQWMLGQAIPERMADGSIMWHGFNTNISERKNTEEQLRASAEEQEWILKSMMNAFVIFQSVFDESGRFVSYRFEYINDAYERITGVTMEGVRGKTVHEVWPGTEPSWIENYGAVAVSGIPRIFDMFHQPTDKLYHCHVFRPWDTTERFCVIFEDITERQKTTEELIRSHEQMRALAGRLRDIREEERKRIARAIHDEMGQALTGIKMDLNWVQRHLADRPEIEQKQVAARLEAMGAMADITIREMRRIITELRPGVLDDLGIVAAVEWLAQDFWNRTGSECSFTPPDEEIDVDPEKAIVIFRIAQEALTNIVRHARATRVSAALRICDGSLVLEVADNGRGFVQEDSRKAGTYGLLGMQERALAIGGAVDIESSPGKGTTVRIRVPFQPQGRDGGRA